MLRPESVLETEVDKHAFPFALRAHTKRIRDARNDLEPAREVVRPPDAGIHQRHATTGAAHPRHLIEHVERRPREPHDTRAESVDRLGAWRQRHSRIRMRSEEHTSEPSHRCISYAVFCLKKKK